MAAISFEELFDPHFMESLHQLRLVAGRVPMGGRFAEQRSKDLGHGIEFRDFRPYAVGDDLRSVDWNIYRRLGRVFLRLFEELEDLPVYLMPDLSDSGFLEEAPGAPLRAHVGLRCALALGAIALGQHDSVGLLPFGSEVEVAMRPASGSGRTMSLAQRLAGLGPRGGTDLVGSLDKLGAMGLRRGLLVVISDFFDPAGIEAITKALGKVRHELLLVRLVRASDADPSLAGVGGGLEGDLRLVDVETGERRDLSITPEALEAYRAAHERFRGGLTGFAERRRAGLLELDVDADVVEQLSTLFEGGRYQA